VTNRRKLILCRDKVRGRGTRREPSSGRTTRIPAFHDDGEELGGAGRAAHGEDACAESQRAATASKVQQDVGRHMRHLVVESQAALGTLSSARRLSPAQVFLLGSPPRPVNEFATGMTRDRHAESDVRGHARHRSVTIMSVTAGSAASCAAHEAHSRRLDMGAARRRHTRSLHVPPCTKAVAPIHTV
jgi:hypothetical protein